MIQSVDEPVNGESPVDEHYLNLGDSPDAISFSWIIIIIIGHGAIAASEEQRAAPLFRHQEMMATRSDSRDGRSISILGVVRLDDLFIK